MTEKKVSFTVRGEPASKANSRRMVMIQGRPRLIKSKKALEYTTYFAAQCPTLPDLMTGDVVVEMTIHYASRRPDLDESLILDLMQGRIYANDRQVKVKHVYWALDPSDPRTEVSVSSL